MNIIKIILSIILLISLVNSSPTFTFKYNSASCGTTIDKPCLITDPTNWESNLAPSTNAIVIIDLSKETVAGSVYIEGTSLNITFASVSVKGSAKNNVFLALSQTELVINNTLTISNYVTLSMDNTGSSTSSNSFYNVEVGTPDNKQGGVFISGNSSLIGTNTKFLSDNILCQADSVFSFTANSNVMINGIVTFYNTPSFTTQYASLVVSDLVDGTISFANGIYSEGLVLLGQSTLGGTSSFTKLVVNSIVSTNDATVVIHQSVSFAGKTAQLDIQANSEVIIQGNSYFPITNTVLSNTGTLEINNPVVNVTGVTGNGGTILFDQLSGESNANYLINVNAPNVAIIVAGGSNIFIDNSNFVSLSDQPSSLEGNKVKNPPTPMVTFEENNVLEFIYTNATMVTFLDASTTKLTGPTTTWITGEQSVNLFGVITIDANYVGSIITMDMFSYIGLNDSYIQGSVDLIAGRLHPTGSASIITDLIITSGGWLDFDETSGNLDVGGNFEMDSSSTVYISQTLIADTTSIMSVAGNMVLNGTLILDLTETSPSAGDRFRLIECKGTVVGSFTTVTPLVDNDLTTLGYSVENNNGIITITFSNNDSVHKKLPGWGVFLIIVAILAVLAGGFYGFIRYKKNQGYLPLN